MADTVTGLNDASVHGIVEHVKHKAAVHLQIVGGDLFQVNEGTHSGAKIIQCDFEALFSDFLNKFYESSGTAERKKENNQVVAAAVPPINFNVLIARTVPNPLDCKVSTKTVYR